MHVYVDLWHSIDGDKNQQNNKFLSPFLLQCIFVLVKKATHRYNFSLLVSFSGD